MSARTVVIGAGAAGLWCALHASERGAVTVIAPGAAELTATAWAQGGVAAVAAADDSPEQHAADTIAAGAGLCDPAAVDVLVREAPQAVAELRTMGMRFDESDSALEGGHSRRRVHHAGGDRSGRALHRFLEEEVERHTGIVRVDARAVGIETGDGGAATGVRIEGGALVTADRVVLATGGACGIFGRRTGPDTSVGEGMALAWHAGAALADLEFVQFHPTALDVPGRPARLLTEALRGEGAVLRDADGERFMDRFHPLGDLAPRDVVARAVLKVREETGAPVYLDATAVPNVAKRFPTADEQCREVGLDIATEPVPVAPAAHYCMGGVLTDLWGRTSVPALFAAGEVANTGVHGANRLASNSLAEALVFGKRAATADGGVLRTPQPVDAPDAEPTGAMALPAIRERADRFLGVRRDGPELDKLAAELASAADPGGGRAATLVAWLMSEAAFRRTESRGGHFRVDHPAPDPAWAVRQVVDHRGWSTLASPAPV
ncbi:MAG TPA: FAD-dependent oxidoreductase [Actinomycetota bacterium]|nr:FAD-dependent oxidoreductase [Actinomycetota bacterium]